MKIINVLSAVFLAVATFFSSCSRSEEITLNVPTTYNFENVDYAGQTIRILMLEELTSYTHSSDAHNQPPLDALKLQAMYENNQTNGSPFIDPSLAGSTKNIKNKVAPSAQNDFINYFSSLAIASKSTNMVASNGQAGIATTNDSTRFLFNENGIELAQIIEKGLAGACMYYQAVSIYLGPTKMNVDNKAIISGKGTNMEHHWDETFGYLGAPKDFPANTSNLSLWAKYSNKVSQAIGSNTKLMNAFLLGRAAITAEAYDKRDEATKIIQEEWELILAAVAISYLNDAKKTSTDMAYFHHYLTKAYAFLMNIRHGPSPKVEPDDLDKILEDLAGSSDPLSANFYTVTLSKINNAINTIATKYTELEAVKASL